ncbi:MAG: hypothetical protein INF92_08920 [Rhodobacter sp.]|nr:hypothetical protein [Rhodobacter sp.]
MSKSDAFESALLALIFQNTNIANIGDATGLRGAVAAGQLFLALHTADPGEAGTQTTSEVAYTGYARVGLARSSGAFTITGNSVSPAANVNFPICTAGSATATHFSVGVASTGAGMVLYKGAISPAIAIAAGVTPQLTTATVITED